MTRTDHGHHIPGTTTKDEAYPMAAARCGGIGICRTCSLEAAKALHPAGKKTIKENGTMAEEYVESAILKFFQYDHLKSAQATVSQEFALLARRIDEELPNSAEKSVALRKLLEAKDAAVRASLDI